MKNKYIHVRVNEDEWTNIKSLMKNEGVDNMSHYVRTKVLNGTVFVEQPEVVIQLTREINAIGQNINQLTKIANTTKNVDDMLLKEVLLNLETIKKKLFHFTHTHRNFEKVEIQNGRYKN